MTARLIAATDGSCLGNPGPAAWAWALAAPDNGRPRVWAAGPLGQSTNNVGELAALLELLRAVPAHYPLEVRMDSQYALNAASKWRHGWRNRGWKTADGKPVKNVELIQAIDAELTSGRDVTFVWVKAHQAAGRGDLMNEFVDAAAKIAAQTQTPDGPGWPATRP